MIKYLPVHSIWFYRCFHFTCSCSIPFSTEDIYMAIPAIDPADIEVPPVLSENPSVQFLLSK